MEMIAPGLPPNRLASIALQRKNMGTDLHKEEFAAFVKVLADRYQPLYIYCFGELSEAGCKEGCFIEHVARENYCYYLLMVLENETRIEHHIQDYVNTHFKHGNITILVHGMETVTAAIRANNRFYITVTNCGKLLYSSDPAIKSFQVPGFIPTKAADKAGKHHLWRMSLATGFLESAMERLRTGKYQLSLFMLHQVVEQCCISLIRVYLA